MRTAIRVLSFLLLSASVHAQTTGTPGLNDLTIAGRGSGAVSCNPLWISPGASIEVSAAQSVPVALLITIDTPGCTSCTASVFPFANSCVSPNTLDLPLADPNCVTLALGGTTDTAGRYSFALPQNLNWGLSAQAVILDPACPFLLFTQAHTLWTCPPGWACN